MNISANYNTGYSHNLVAHPMFIAWLAQTYLPHDPGAYHMIQVAAQTCHMVRVAARTVCVT